MQKRALQADSIVLPNLTYGFSVHGASDTDLNVFQQFYTDAVSYVLCTVLVGLAHCCLYTC